LSEGAAAAAALVILLFFNDAQWCNGHMKRRWTQVAYAQIQRFLARNGFSHKLTYKLRRKLGR
jgi:hypothetical protein